jgi:hypothetical protein
MYENVLYMKLFVSVEWIKWNKNVLQPEMFNSGY